MLSQEAKWIGEATKNLDVYDILDVSGGSWFFRNIRQPFIKKYIFRNFKNKKIRRTNINNNVCSKNFNKIGKYDLVFANNLLEHVGNIKNAAKNLLLVVNPKGYLCVSVPHDFPYHPDPIDNKFRPLPDDLVKLFPKTKIIKKALINQKIGLMITRYGILINKTYSVSCVVLQKGV
jgi:SAM-dependent methyltransferase